MCLMGHLAHIQTLPCNLFLYSKFILTVCVSPFQLKPGAEGNGVGEAKRNFTGDGKFELPVKEGEALVIISEKGCPQGKWLIKNPEGHCMFNLCQLL